jgi:hypothetical protein
MSPLELIVLIGIIIAFTAFALTLFWVSRADGKLSLALAPASRRVAVKVHPAAPHDGARRI